MSVEFQSSAIEFSTPMHQYQEQIDRETAKVRLLQKKIAECERRIAMLRSMAADDPLDKLLEEELRGPSHHAEDEVEPPFVSETDLKTRRKRIPPNWFRLLLFIGEEGKSSDEVRSFLSANGDLGITPDASRTGLMNYRKEYGFVDSPGRGFYKLTPLGTAAMKAQIESPDIWR